MSLATEGWPCLQKRRGGSIRSAEYTIVSPQRTPAGRVDIERNGKIERETEGEKERDESGVYSKP
jgi:hypothetical protein